MELTNALKFIDEFVRNCNYDDFNDDIHDQLKEACRAVLDAHRQEKTRVQLMHGGPQKIQVIKAIRQWSGLGLKEAKDITDYAGSQNAIIELPSRTHAEDMLKAVREAGGTMLMLDQPPLPEVDPSSMYGGLISRVDQTNHLLHRILDVLRLQQ